MQSVFAFFANRRKALGYIVAALAEYITQLLPQSNPQNAQVLHGIVLALGFLLVYLPENSKAAAGSAGVQEFIDDLVRGDAPAKHEAPEAAPAPAPEPAPLPPVPAPAAPSLQG